MQGLLSEPIYQGTTVALYCDLYDEARGLTITDPAEVSFEVRAPSGAVTTTALSTAGVTASLDTPGLYVGQYEATEAGRYKVIARAESLDGHKVAAVGGFSVHQIPAEGV